MRRRNATDHLQRPAATGGYCRPAIVLHWLIALAIFFLFVSSWWMLGLPLSSAELRFRAFPFQLHTNIGITLVAFALILMFLRFRTPPAAAESVPRRTARFGLVGHLLLYLLLLAVAASGYLSSAHTRWDTTVWWLVDLPRIAAPDEQKNRLYAVVHLWTCWALLAVVALHISGAVYHAFRADGSVRRMLRW